MNVCDIGIMESLIFVERGNQGKLASDLTKIKKEKCPIHQTLEKCYGQHLK